MAYLSYPTVSSAVVLDLYDGLSELGFVTKPDISALGFDRSDLLDVEKRLSAESVEKLWDLAERNGAPAHVGLLIGRRLAEGSRGMLSNLAMSASTLHEALILFEKYISVMSEVESIKLKPVSEGLQVSYHFNREQHYREASIARSMLAGVTWACHLTGRQVEPVEAGFMHKEFKNSELYFDAFGCGCRFGAKNNYLIVSKLDLKRPILSSNEFLKKLIRQRLESVKINLDSTGAFSRAVCDVIEDNLHRGVVTSEFVACDLNTTRQTLHRRLSAEGVSFSILISRIRKDKAQYHLKKGCCNLERLSEILGFREPSAFFKAFKIWFNTTPRQFISKQ